MIASLLLDSGAFLKAWEEGEGLIFPSTLIYYISCKILKTIYLLGFSSWGLRKPLDLCPSVLGAISLLASSTLPSSILVIQSGDLRVCQC